ncbi:MAG: hypothetical protein LBF78_01205 [Treponema sp.]|nr:hypothetical protein [Treponema sp.]
MKKLLLLIFLVPALFAACNMEVGDFKYFDYTLRGYWKTTSSPYHELEITLNAIKIMPYAGRDIPGFPGYTRNVTLKGYSEEGNYTYPAQAGSLFILDRGIWQPAVPYRIWEGGNNEKMLTIIGSGSQETTFKKQ